MVETGYFTERDAAAALEILAQASADPREIAVLTDEEVLALGGNELNELAGTPFLDSSAAMDRAAAASIAARSLIARGLVVLDPEDRENEGEELSEGSEVPARAAQLDRTLAGIMTLRAGPLAVVNLSRRVADQTTSVLVYAYPEGGALEELVTADGYHRFSVPTPQALPERLARYVDQNGVAAAEDGETHEGTVAELEGDSAIAQRLRDTRALTVLTSVTVEGAVQLTFMATSDGVLVMDTPQEAQDRAVVREVGAATLREMLAAAVPEASAL